MSKKYFSKLNYTLANEDTTLEYNIVAKIKPRKTLSVCGSGGRSLPLLAHTNDVLVCADLSQQQIYLAKMRLESFAKLEWDGFLRFWGFAPYREDENCNERKTIFQTFKLEKEVREYFETVFEEIGYRSLIYEGKWEKTFTSVSRKLRPFVGSKYDAMFEFKNLDKQRAYFDEVLTKWSWKLIPRLVVLAVGNAAFFNAFLYKGHFIKRNIPETHFQFYIQTFRKLFYQALTRENFFLQLIFLGRIKYSEGNPMEARKEVFQSIKSSSNKTCEFVTGDLISYAEKGAHKFDFVSLSDVPSYFSEQLDRVYLQKLSKGLEKNALVVLRCYLRIPENTDMTNFMDVTDEFKEWIAEEKTQMYKTFIYKYSPA